MFYDVHCIPKSGGVLMFYEVHCIPKSGGGTVGPSDAGKSLSSASIMLKEHGGFM